MKSYIEYNRPHGTIDIYAWEDAEQGRRCIVAKSSESFEYEMVPEGTEMPVFLKLNEEIWDAIIRQTDVPDKEFVERVYDKESERVDKLIDALIDRLD